MKKYFTRELALFICLFLIDLIFYFLTNKPLGIITILRFILFDLALCFLISLFTSKAKNDTKNNIYFVVIFFFSIYALVEIQFGNFMGHYYSVNAIGDGLKGVSIYIPIFFRNIKPVFLLCLLPIAFYIVFDRLYKGADHKLSGIKKLLVFVCLIGLFLLTFVKEDKAFISAVKNHDRYDVVLEKIGINSFLFEDSITSFLPSKDNDELIIEEITPIQEEIVEPEEIDYKRHFDDSRFKEALANETNETYQKIGNYVLSRSIADKNEYTGIYSGYNFVYFMVESLDYMAIDEKLTPTLYKMYKEGHSFLNHYTPIYVCGTGDSEWVGMTGTFPTMSDCVAYNTSVYSGQSLAGLFHNAGYNTYSFHNWTDQFYPRNTLELNYGFDAYYDYDALGITPLNGWLSDEELVEKALPYFINDEHFFAFIITSSMHFPYDEDTTLGNRYLNEINEVYPDYPMVIKRYLSKSIEFDHSLGLLLEELKMAGKLDNTVISIYGDHHPKTLSADALITYSTTLKKEGTYATNLLPFIIYCPSYKGEFVYDYCCNVDQLPTIANMFDLNYDPRLYCGSDIFDHSSVAILPNGDWKDINGQYFINSDTYEPYDENKTVSEEIWRPKANDVANMRKINIAMINSDFYRNYKFVIDPVKK